jgi:hypothetical protein
LRPELIASFGWAQCVAPLQAGVSINKVSVVSPSLGCDALFQLATPQAAILQQVATPQVCIKCRLYVLIACIHWIKFYLPSWHGV